MKVVLDSVENEPAENHYHELKDRLLQSNTLNVSHSFKNLIAVSVAYLPKKLRMWIKEKIFMRIPMRIRIRMQILALNELWRTK
jgi:hypothetical protein